MDQVAEYRKQIHNHILSNVFHPYLRRFINEPEIDDDRISMFILLLQEPELSDYERDQVITAAMLVQIALEIHDNVKESRQENEDDTAHKVRQLSVLAGDYYSGLYYYSLSLLGNIEAVRSLAAGIKEINEQKVILYKSNYKSEEELFSSVTAIESALLTNIAECFNTEKYIPLIQSFMLLKRLQAEKKKMIRNQYSSVYEAISNFRFHRSLNELSLNDRNQIDLIVKNKIDEMNAACMNAYHSLMQENVYVSLLFKQLLTEEEFICNSNVEEG